MKLNMVDNYFQAREDITWTWHKRYGHLNFQPLKIIFSQKMVKGLSKRETIEDIWQDCVNFK